MLGWNDGLAVIIMVFYVEEHLMNSTAPSFLILTCMLTALCLAGSEVPGDTDSTASTAQRKSTTIPAEQPEKNLTFFLRRLRTLDHLPELESSHTAMSSTWDRTGGNRDGWDFKRIENGRNILLDVDGPGCIHRIFTGWLGEGNDILGKPGPAGTHIQIYLDHKDQPVFDMPVEQFFDDRDGPFPYPLVFHKTYPGILFPIPFAKHCRVQLANSDAPNWGNYWQIACTTYPSGTAVRSLTWPLDAREAKELARVRLAWLEAESRQPAVPREWAVRREFALPPGEEQEIVINGTGVIRQMRVAVTMSTPDVLSDLRLQMRWDGRDKPSVDVPLGYFSGNAHYGYLNEIHFNSLLNGITPSETYSCFPMPFEKGAAIRLVNRSSHPAHNVRVLLDVEHRDSLPDNWGRFHASHAAQRAATEESPRFGPRDVPGHLALEREGPGKYVGMLLFVQWPHTDWWGEGDVLIWTDEEGWPPSYHGTGTEEYFNSGWCSFDRKAVSGHIKTRPGNVALYSFHLNDAFQFQRNIRVALETLGLDGFGMRGDTIIHRDHPLWSSTAFWYARPARPAGSTPELIPR